LPDVPPVPLSQSVDLGAGTGFITFDKPLNTKIALTPTDFRWGTGSGSRLVTAASYSGSSSIAIGAMDPITFGATPSGWNYIATGARIEGTNGLEVANFAGFTGA